MDEQNSVDTDTDEEIDVRFERLVEFRPDAEAPTLEAPLDPVNLPEDLGMPEGLILSFDQALANTGYVAAGSDSFMDFYIGEMGVLKTTSIPGKKSWPDTLGRAAHLFEMVRDLIAKVGPVLILHEMPPVGNGPTMFRTDSSVVTATVIQVAASAAGIPCEMVAANKVKAYLTGNAKADKKEVRKALERNFPDQLSDPSLRKNEHTFDALGILITYIHYPITMR